VKLIWSRFARSDRDRIFNYIEARSPNAAAAVDERIAIAARRLTAFPESGRPGRVTGTRELVVPRTPFVIVYSVTEDTAFVRRVLHGAQLWPDEFSND
jgi:toxin ParE1/3/4